MFRQQSERFLFKTDTAASGGSAAVEAAACHAAAVQPHYCCPWGLCAELAPDHAVYPAWWGDGSDKPDPKPGRRQDNRPRKPPPRLAYSSTPELVGGEACPGTRVHAAGVLVALC